MGEANGQLIRFLSQDLGLSSRVLATAQKLQRRVKGPLPMVLLQYGLIDLMQLQRILDWQVGL